MSTASGASPVTAMATSVYTVPTDQPEADGTLAWTSTTLVVVEVHAAGQTGLGWSYAAAAAKGVVDDTFRPIVLASDPLSVTATHDRLAAACRNEGRPGIAACAISAVDIALWDLKARIIGMPLTDLWGRVESHVPAYGSGGFTTYDARTLDRQLGGWLSRGARAVKIKIGQDWGMAVERDLSRVAQTREVVGADVEVFVDANGAYTAKQAIRVGRQIVGRWGVSWFEEPVSSDDTAGLAMVRRLCDADIAAGEYGYEPRYFANMINHAAVDCLQADVTRCGGYTGWLRTAQLAAAHGLEVSAHCAPSLHVPVAAAIQNLRHLEYFHDHDRIEHMLFDRAPRFENGRLAVNPGPGHGMSLRRAEAEAYRTG